MPFTTAQLKAELQNDPTALGYAAKYESNDPQGAADLLNAVRQTISVKRSDVMASEILEAIDIRDLVYPGTGQLPAASQPLANAWMESILQLTRCRLAKDDGTDTTVLKNLKLLLTATGQGSKDRIVALSLRTGSRAEQLFGAGTAITASDVANALVS